MPEFVAFSGHRNRKALQEALQAVLVRFHGATLVHGGAKGFDEQVEALARSMGIETLVVRPDYASHGRAAPHIRNREIVDMCQELVALWDGREKGGTYGTMLYAQRRGLAVEVVPCG